MATENALEQAEARLAEAKDALMEELRTGDEEGQEVYRLLDLVGAAGSEVGRLRALALTDEDRPRLEHAIYNVYSQDDSLPRLDIYHVRQIADAVVAALVAREEVQGVEKQIDAILARRASVLRDLGEEVQG